MARPIDQDDAAARRQCISKRETLVLEIAARAMQQHDRRADGSAWRREIDDVQPTAGNRHEAAGGAVDAFKPSDAKRRDDDAGSKDRDDDDERDEEGHEHGPHRRRALTVNVVA
jgi:hypothetical protein